jgi:short-subunit dehydrogenase
MNILIVGASGGLGRALAEEGAKQGHSLFLCSSDSRDLEALANSLRLRYGIEVKSSAIDVSTSEDRCRLLLETNSGQPLDALFLPLGLSMDDDTGFLEEGRVLKLVSVNFVAQTFLITDLWKRLDDRGGYIVGFGSIASIRGRRRNVIYSAAKRSLACYFESLRALAKRTGISVQFYELGYMNTQQAFGRKLLLPIADPKRVAQVVFRRLGKSQNAIFYPTWWRLVSWALRLLPWTIYKRLEF